MHKLLLKRREFILGLGALTGVSSFTAASRLRQSNVFLPEAAEQSDLVFAQEISTLRAQAAAKGLIFGAAGQYKQLNSDKAYANLFAQQCGMLVPENELKFNNLLRPSPNRFDFTRSDWLARFARSHDMLLRGHTLVWHVGLPNWFKATVNKQNAEKILREHIAIVAGHYAGRIHSWDVVNEAINLDSQRSDNLRNTPWLQFLGPDYIDLAFRTASDADPQALLVYNDFDLDYDIPKAENKRNATLKLLERWKAKGTPIQALGTQAHLQANPRGLQFTRIRRFLSNVADLGLKILITELDVHDRNLPRDSGVRDREVASMYEDYLSAVLDEPAVIAVITWGLSDRYTWLASNQPRSDKAPVRPLPFDGQLKPKLAYQAIARAIAQAPARSAQPETPTLSDIQGHWAQRYIQALADRNIISGFPDRTFRPNTPVTRAEFAAIVNKAFTPTPRGSNVEFSDVPRGFWGYDAIQTAARSGFLAGYPGGSFQPNQQIPRVQVIVALASGLNLSSDNTSVLSVYQDAGQIPAYATTKVAAATQRQIVVSYPSVRLLNPNLNATRADVAAFVYQALVNAGKAQPLSSPYVVQP